MSGKSERQGLERRDMRQFCDNFHSSQSSSRFSRILNCRRRGRLCMQAYIRGDRRLKYGCFFGKVPKGGEGLISDPKNYIADFVGFKAVYFGNKFYI